MNEVMTSYLKIRQYVFVCIGNAKYNGAEPKILKEVDIAKAFGVCRTTVRKALDRLVAEDILMRKPGLGTFIRPEYIDAFSSTFGNKMIIGLILGDGMVTFLDEYALALNEVVFSRLKTQNCLVRLINFNGNPEQEAKLFGKNRLDGIIWLGPELVHIPVLQILKSSHIPVVSVFPKFISEEFDYVSTDYRKCYFMTTKYLLNRGHRNILYLCRKHPDIDKEKKIGCTTAFAEYGLEWNGERYYSLESFPINQIINILKNAGDFSAVICHTACLEDVKNELADRKDIQILHNVSCDSEVSKGTAGVLLPITQAVTMATDILIQRIKQSETDEKTQQLLLERTIIERDGKTH